METVKIKQTDITPEVILDVNTKTFLIAGISMPSDPRKFYLPIINWIIEYKNNPIEDARICIKLDYFNTASAKMILELMKHVKSIGNGNKIIWMHDPTDEDIMEVGAEYQEMLGEDVLVIEASKPA